MKTAIVGSRTITDYARLLLALDGMEITEVVSGGAAGADALAERWARENNKKLTVMPADWKKYGKSAGMVRNADIVKAAEVVIALWDGQSPGTKATISMAERDGKKVKIVRI